MIAKKYRFHGHGAVARVRGKKISGPGYSVYSKKSRRNNYRLAVVVSKKTAKSAVTRNRIRRRLFELFRIDGRLDGKNLDVVVVVHDSDLATRPHDQLVTAVSSSISTLTD